MSELPTFKINYELNAYWLSESSPKYQRPILNNSREIHISPIPFPMDIWNYRVATLLKASHEKINEIRQIGPLH